MWTGVVVAYIFTSIPAWTTWVLLVAMALYDLFAVLTPHGPLQMLVNLAIERDEDIPALVYEAREVRRPRRRAAAAAAAAPDGEFANDAEHLRDGTAAAPADGPVRHGEDADVVAEAERPVFRGGAGAAGAVGEATEDGIHMGDIDGGAAHGVALGAGWPVGSSGRGALSHELARLHRPPVCPPILISALTQDSDILSEQHSALPRFDSFAPASQLLQNSQATSTCGLHLSPAHRWGC